MRLLRWSIVLVAASALLAACAHCVDPARPVPTALLPAPLPAHRLVVVLPGRRDRLESLRRSGVGEAIQRVWPDADVLFAELSMPYYLDRSAARRLHDEVLLPARRRAYTEIWLVGASLGGMGSILYDRSYGAQVDGMVLLAPYTGERPIRDEIRAAGGLAAWNPATSRVGDWQADLWSGMKHWRDEPARTRNVWLGYGEDDYLREGMPLVAELLPPGHVVVQPGRHAWSTWTPMTEAIFRRIDAERATPPAAR